MTLTDGSTAFAEATCPAGQQAIGGGASAEATGADDIQMLVSRPGPGTHVPNDNEEFGADFSNTWRTAFRNVAGAPTTAASDIRSFVLCVPAG